MSSALKNLTKAEEQVMQALWKIEKGFLRDLLNALPEPRPHQNTVATIVRILIDKKFIGKEVFGRTHLYFPLVSKEMYSRSTIKSVVRRYFSGSFSDAVSFMVKEKNLSIKDLETLVRELKKNTKQ